MPSALAGIESYAAEARGRVENTLNHLAEVSTFLAGVPGVKTLVYLSDALDLRTGADLVQTIGNVGLYYRKNKDIAKVLIPDS